MKSLLLSLALLIMCSCQGLRPTYKIEVTYSDNQKDTISVKEHTDVWLDELQESPYINVWVEDPQGVEFHDLVYDVVEVRRLHE